jgi:hypothetical protein
VSATQITLLSNIEHGVPSGNYDGSSTDFFSDAAQAVGFYQGQGSVQTVLINVANFTGSVITQATLGNNPESAAWFDVDVYEPGTNTTQIHSVSALGNFVWIRVAVQDFESGTINSVTLSY